LLSKLIRFVLVTRFSKPLLAFLVLLFAYNFLISTFANTNVSSLLLISRYYGPGIIAFLLALTTLSGGIVVLKSDRDYLFTLPLDKRELALSLYIAQFVASGITIFLVFSFFSSSIVVGGYSHLLLVVDLIALTLAVTSLSVVSNVLKTGWRLLVALLLTLWAFPGALGLAFTPASMFTGSVVYGSASMLTLTDVVTFVAFRELSNVELGTMRSLIRATSPEVKNIRSFAGMSPVRAIFSQNFSILQFAGRMNLGTASRYQTGSVRITRVIPVTVALALLYGYVALALSSAIALGNAAASILPMFVLFFAFFSSQGGMANERAWLALTAMEPPLYFRYVSIAKVLSLIVAVLPFAIVNVVLFFMGVSGTLVPVIPLLVTIPCSMIIFLYWSSRIAPVQIKEEAPMMPSQFNLGQMTAVVPFVIFILVTEVSTFVSIAAVAVAAATLVLTLYLLFNPRAWDRLAEKLIENGFM
jgi:hypothetical protein